MDKKWRRELARDLIAFGSIPFLVLTIARVSVLTPYYPMQFVMGGAIFFILRLKFKAEMHAGLGFILLAFVSIYYGNLLFTIFASIVYAGIVSSLFYLGTERRLVFKGIVLGVVSTVIAYYLVRAILGHIT